MKDPAFLFYSQDFYVGTRLMLPIERACYIDLMIYQHQNGFIPDDIERISLFCNGIDKATLKATLKAKFKHCSEGWYNERLKSVVENRKDYKDKLSISGKVGQFWKKTKAASTAKEYKVVRDFLKDKSKQELINIIEKINTKYKGSFKGWLKELLKHIENENENEDNINNKKDVYLKFDHLSITETDHKKLTDEFGEKSVGTIYKKIENYRQNTRYKCLYSTAIDWLQRNNSSSNTDKFESFTFPEMSEKMIKEKEIMLRYKPVQFKDPDRVLWVSIDDIKKHNLKIKPNNLKS